MKVLAVIVLAAGSIAAAAMQHPKRPVSPSSATAAPEPDTLRASRSEVRLPLQPVNTAHSRGEGTPRPVMHRRARPAGAAALNWRALAYCEATGDPRAVSPDGRYYGLYQFDLGTWRSVGGRGNPADASREEQTFRAELLYAQRGRAPWPVCGRFL